MRPTEHEGTVAIDAAAKKLYALSIEGEESPQPFDELHPLMKRSLREQVLPLVWAALEALPDRAVLHHEEWGRQTKDDSRGNGHMVGHVSSIFRTREMAAETMYPDQRLVKRQVGTWEPVDE